MWTSVGRLARPLARLSDELTFGWPSVLAGGRRAPHGVNEQRLPARRSAFSSLKWSESHAGNSAEPGGGMIA